MTDDDLFDTDETVETQSDEKESSVVRSQRAHIRQLEKEIKAARKDAAEIEELRQFRAQYEQAQKASQAKAVFTELGLPDKLADLYVKVNAEAEATPEAVRSFAESYGLVTQQPEAESTPAVQPFVPTVGGTPPPPTQMSAEEIRQIGLKNPAEALRLIQQGSLRRSS